VGRGRGSNLPAFIIPPKNAKRAITDLVMALGRKTRKRVGFWLHHPVVVGRLMPTLIRTRVVAARNMFY
jgi:hypothetical protein